MVRTLHDLLRNKEALSSLKYHNSPKFYLQIYCKVCPLLGSNGWYSISLLLHHAVSGFVWKFQLAAVYSFHSLIIIIIIIIIFIMLLSEYIFLPLQAKKAYFQAQFRLNSENLKTTWKLIGTIINGTKGCGKPPITKLIYKNRCYTDKANIAHKLNTHFINIGHELADRLDPVTKEEKTKRKIEI